MVISNGGKWCCTPSYRTHHQILRYTPPHPNTSSLCSSSDRSIIFSVFFLSIQLNNRHTRFLNEFLKLAGVSLQFPGVLHDSDCHFGTLNSTKKRNFISQCNRDGSEFAMVKSSGYLKLTDGLNGKNQVSVSNQERNFGSVMTKDSRDMHQRPYQGSEVHTSQSNQEGSSLSVLPGKGSDSENRVSESNEQRTTHSIIPERVPDTLEQTPSPDASVPESQSAQENFVVALRPEKGLDKLPLRRNPENAVNVLHSDQGVTFSRLPEKPNVDGFNWRKYGQKLVRGNVFVRSYYKCTFANCPARKQVERSHDGHITEINYLCKHEHPKPAHTLLKSPSCVHPNQARGSDEPSLTSEISRSSEIESELSPTRALPCANPQILHRKKESVGVNDSVVTKTNYEPRVIVQTTSAVDIVNDGYRWRKYGQKLVKGNPNPRSYYRCSNAGCPVKKHVERASHDEKVVITTYEGRHDHDMPAGTRTVTQNTQGNNNESDDDDDESTPQPESANESTGTEMVVRVDAN
ncbi:DNA-binding WRKY [Cynara cardunculus var. scolymus]|uniref:DNA-binding WRKY n=1 Tax=Cynara cardunculus var. scolymus TaxID=59895 RepID=A0A103Y3W9_CYNCS|nr:DNA-binding WRKY [Cynara cardunculus var. scolymus]